MAEPVIGIDLGTTNSVVATVQSGTPVVIPNRSGYRLTPSVVAIAKNGKRLVGALARRQAVTNAERTVVSVKRLMGRKWSSRSTQEALARLPYTVVPHDKERDDLLIQLGETTCSPPEISAMVLAELRLDAEAFLGKPVTKAVITVPAYFNDSQRNATKDSGRIAGLDVIRIINEPTSASLAYGFGKQIGEKQICVFDLGGGTFDFTVLHMYKGVFEVEATGGDSLLGGDDFDNRVVDWLAQPFLEKHGIDLRKEKMSLQRLRDAAEKAKCELSSTQQMEVLTRDLVDRCLGVCEQVMAEAKVKPTQLGDVLLVGGQTRMPLIQARVRHLFGREPSKAVNPDEAVAVGAAIQGAMLMHQEQEMLLLDVTPHSLGIAIAGGFFQSIIPKNTTVPTSAHHVFITVKDDQTSAKITVLQGESEIAAQNELLGEFMMIGLRKAKRGEVDIDVIFDISADGIVSVSALDVQTGLRQSITVTASSGLTEDEIKTAAKANEEWMLGQKHDPGEQVLRPAAGRPRSLPQGPHAGGGARLGGGVHAGAFQPARARVLAQRAGADPRAHGSARRAAAGRASVAPAARHAAAGAGGPGAQDGRPAPLQSFAGEGEDEGAAARKPVGRRSLHGHPAGHAAAGRRGRGRRRVDHPPGADAGPSRGGRRAVRLDRRSARAGRAERLLRGDGAAGEDPRPQAPGRGGAEAPRAVRGEPDPDVREQARRDGPHPRRGPAPGRDHLAQPRSSRRLRAGADRRHGDVRGPLCHLRPAPPGHRPHPLPAAGGRRGVGGSRGRGQGEAGVTPAIARPSSSAAA